MINKLADKTQNSFCNLYWAQFRFLNRTYYYSVPQSISSLPSPQSSSESHLHRTGMHVQFPYCGVMHAKWLTLQLHCCVPRFGSPETEERKYKF